MKPQRGRIKGNFKQDDGEPPTIVKNENFQETFLEEEKTNNAKQQAYFQNRSQNFDPRIQPGLDNMAQSQTVIEETISILIFDQYKDEKTCYQKQQIHITDKQEILLSFLLQNLENQDAQLQDSLVSYYDPFRDQYVFCDKFPCQGKSIPKNCIINNQIEIKIRKNRKTLEELLIEESKKNQGGNDDVSDQGTSSKYSRNNTNNRVKERKIGEVVEKVALWRRFYNGFYNEKSEFIHLPLDIAANKVGISKKTLDDYLLQIRCGKKYGFDFNKNFSQKIGMLRTFVKNQRNQRNNNSSIQCDNITQKEDNDQ